jgi:hypothetical protein
VSDTSYFDKKSVVYKPEDEGDAKVSLIVRSMGEKLKHFQEVQYPFLYAKFYDFYNYNLVGYKPLDIVLKILMILTILILYGDCADYSSGDI